MKRIVLTVCAILVGAAFMVTTGGCTQKLKQENAKLTAQVQDLTSQAQRCNTEKGQIGAQIQTLQQQVSALTQEKAELQKKVEELSKKPAGKKPAKKK